MNTLSQADAFDTDAKLGLLATVSAGGLPHVTLITSLAAKGPSRLMFGQFTEGLSKAHLRDDPRCAFLIMTQDRRLWRGRARWTGAVTEGADLQAYNQRPMFRYNAYTGIHTVHYLDVQQAEGPHRVGLAGLLRGAAAARLSRTPLRPPDPDPLGGWGRRHLGRSSTLKFLAWLDGDLGPVLWGPLAAFPEGRAQIRLGAGRLLEQVPREQPLALFAIDLQTRSLLLRGPYLESRRGLGGRTARMGIDWVYNPMPPVHGQVFPPVPLEPARDLRAR